MRIGLDGSPLLNLKTGVGRYTHELVTALTELPHRLNLSYYYGTYWSNNLLSVDIEGVARTLESVLDDSRKCREMSHRVQQQAAKFTWQTCAEKTYNVYQKTLGHNFSLST